MSYRRQKKTDPDDENPRGHWLDDGSWRDDPTSSEYSGAGSGTTTRAVREFVWMRRNGMLTPHEAAMMIEARPLIREAFPSRSAWLDFTRFDDWPQVPSVSSAETSVKYAGQGALAHWRGGECLRYPTESDEIPKDHAIGLAALWQFMWAAGRSPSIVAAWLLEHWGEAGREFAQRLEEIGDGVELFPPLPSVDDMVMLAAGKYDPRWYPNAALDVPEVD